MKKFEGRSDGGMYITENQAQIHLAPHEAYALWRWLSARKDTFPDLHERGPIFNAFDPGWETVTERALQLHKEFQAQYHVHPLLEDDSTYAQG